MIALVLLLFSLPVRLRRVWGEAHPWRRLGLAGGDPGVGGPGPLPGFLLGALLAAALLAVGTLIFTTCVGFRTMAIGGDVRSTILLVFHSHSRLWAGPVSPGSVCGVWQIPNLAKSASHCTSGVR